MTHLNKAYISPIDEFLFKFDKNHEKSASQMREILKHKRIFQLRDNPVAPENKEEIWEEF
jgi:hypothetical protein